MITETDALDLAQRDANAIHGKIEQGLMPDQVGKMAMKLFIRHVDSLGDSAASERARQGAVQKMSASTLSELTLAQMMSIFNKTMGRLQPEDTRALVLWLNGTPPHVPGMLQHLVYLLGESSGQHVVQRYESELTLLLRQMQEADTALFEIKLKSLNKPRRCIIRGLLLESQWAFQERDGITVRNHVIRARKLAMRWLKEQARNKANGI